MLGQLSLASIEFRANCNARGEPLLLRVRAAK
jgi:hypothetical protein